ncbi:MAG TPA: hypothetical protein VJ780_07280 [Flavobacterium sp.]|nr:hypothetical protein [Flavobacterium sp.]
METGTKCLIQCFVMAATGTIILLCLFGCGKRTTSTTRTEIKNDSLRIENSFELTQNATFSDIGSVRPFDASKAMLWNGKWYYNTIIDFDKSVSSGSVLKGSENLSYTNSESQEKNKETQKTDYSNLWIGLSAVIGTLFVLYLTLKKYIP